MRLPTDVLSRIVAEAVDQGDGVAWRRLADVPYDAIAVDTLTPDQISAVRFITFIEDHIPDYFDNYRRAFPIVGETDLEAVAYHRTLYHVAVGWAAEEDRHAHALATYQIRAGLAEPASLQASLAAECSKPFALPFERPHHAFAYALLQEKATQIYYTALRNAVQEPVLQQLLALLIRDESRHFSFFCQVVDAFLEHHGAEAARDFRDVLSDFKMPLYSTLENYWRWAIRIADAAGGYDHAEAYPALTRRLDRYLEAPDRHGDRARDLLRDMGGV